MRCVALCVALVASSARGGEPVPALTVPAEVSAAPAVITEIRAETTGKRVVWVPLTPGLSVRAIDNGRVLLVSGAPGRYELLAYTALADVPSEPARCIVLIGKPPLPELPDALAEKVRAALDGDAERDTSKKRKLARQLAVLYRELAREAQDAALTSPKEFRQVARDAAARMIGPDALAGVRKEVAAELAALLPTDAPFSEAQRAAVAKLFDRLAAILDGS
jgi:hypothetical protein